MKGGFPKLADVNNQRMYLLEDLKRIFNKNKPILRQYIASGYLKPEMESSGPGTRNIFNRYGLIRVGFIISLAELKLPWKKAADLINSIDQLDLQGLLEEEVRYLCVHADDKGIFNKPVFMDSFEFDGEVQDFKENQRTLIIIDGQKVLQQIEEKI